MRPREGDASSNDRLVAMIVNASSSARRLANALAVAATVVALIATFLLKRALRPDVSIVHRGGGALGMWRRSGPSVLATTLSVAADQVHPPAPIGSFPGQSRGRVRHRGLPPRRPTIIGTMEALHRARGLAEANA